MPQRFHDVATLTNDFSFIKVRKHLEIFGNIVSILLFSRPSSLGQLNCLFD